MPTTDIAPAPLPDKPGWKTSEFWVTVLAPVFSAFFEVPPEYTVALAGALGAAYSASRAFVKAFRFRR